MKEVKKRNVEKIQHNLDLSEPLFIEYIKGMSYDLARWIQYRGCEVHGDSLLFVFSNSQRNLTFKVYAGVNLNDTNLLLQSYSKEIYDHFRRLKNEHINK